MIHAYDQTLLNKARITLGWMFDYAVNLYEYQLDDFYNIFLESPLSSRFAKGESRIIAGMSGVELAYEVISEVVPNLERQENTMRMGRSSEYWVGHSLAYYQWYIDESFETIVSNVGINEVHSMYEKYHEMDIRQFVDAMNEKRQICFSESALKRLRAYAGYSQRELANQAGVPLRTIQQYEQKQKDINKASVETVYRLSKALYCKPEDLLNK